MNIRPHLKLDYGCGCMVRSGTMSKRCAQHKSETIEFPCGCTITDVSYMCGGGMGVSWKNYCKLCLPHFNNIMQNMSDFYWERGEDVVVLDDERP
jgi:hypothetical protein